MSSYILSCKASVINWSNAFREQSRKLESAMDCIEDKNGLKERILEEIGKSVKLVQYHALSASGSPVPLGAESWVVQGLCRWVDRAFLHGLRRLQSGYWPVMRTLAHSDTVSAIESLSHIDSPLGLGRAWLHLALTEGTLESHVAALVREVGDCPKEELEEARSLLRRHYTPRALLRDPTRASRFLAALFPLQTVHFCLEPDVSYFEVSCYVPGVVVGVGGFMGGQWEQPFPGPEIGSGGCNTPMTSSLTSSTLPSPGDSGVALLPDGDDADATEDDSSYSEIEDNRINRMLSMEMECKSEPEIMSTNIDLDNTGRTNVEAEQILDSVNEEQVEVIRSKPANVLGYSASQPRPCGDPKRGQTDLENAEWNEGAEDQSPSPVTGMYSESLVTMMPKSPTMTDSGIQAESPVVEAPDSTWILEENRVPPEETKTAPEPEPPKETGGVILRKTARRKDAPVKRVSFHEDFQENNSSESTMTVHVMLEPNVRHSWCSGADINFHEWNAEGMEASRYRFSKGQLVTSLRSDAKENVEPQSTVPPVTERGVPEGQEDPPSNGACRSPFRHGSRNLSCSETSISKHSSLSSLSGKPAAQAVHLRGKPVAAVRPRRRYDGLPKLSAQKVEGEVWGSKGDISSDQEDKNGWIWWPPLFVEGITPDLELCKQLNQEMDAEILAEERNKITFSIGECPKRVKELLAKEVLTCKDDLVYKVFKVRSNFSVVKCRGYQRISGSPLLAVLSSQSLYIVGCPGDFKLQPGSWFSQRGTATYEKRFEICYGDLDTVVVGPNYQALTFCTKATDKVKASHRKKQFSVITGEKEVSMDILNHLEIAMRRWHQSAAKKILISKSKNYQISNPYPAIAVLSMDKLANYLTPLQPKGYNSEAIRRMIGPVECEQSQIVSGMPCKVVHYSLVHVEDEHPATPPCTPLGPTRRGHLMFHAHSILPGPTSASSSGWQPAYFLLKAGVLYKFDDALSRLPSWAIPLEGGQPSGPHGWECQGFRRVLDEPRPHTFEVLLGRGRSLRLAAADEYEASDWLQAFVQSASSGINGCPDGLVGDVEGPFVLPCSLMLTDIGQIITCHEEGVRESERIKVMGNLQTISLASLSDVTSLRTAPEGAGFWCALEFDCREVHERGGDWILHFPSIIEMQNFMATLKDVWSSLNFEETIPVNVADNDELISRCAHSSRYLASSWDALLLSLQGSQELEESRDEPTVR